jgi:hypothetical protein
VFDNWKEINLELSHETMQDCEEVKRFNENAVVYHFYAKPKGPTSPRDMVVFFCFLTLSEDTFAIVGNSVESDIPVPPDHIRGEMKLNL